MGAMTNTITITQPRTTAIVLRYSLLIDIASNIPKESFCGDVSSEVSA
jgi:hypothetical protein